MTDYLPFQLLALARGVVDKPHGGTVAAALLTRQSLEVTLDRYWSHRAPAVAASPMRTQLLCLATYADDDTAGRAAIAWSTLSRACHRHPYELAPARTEILRAADDVERLAHDLAVPKVPL